ncbi:MAG: porin [Cruoricaptor ignavus]|nr:porin [Cruoricaptor ignavus]
MKKIIIATVALAGISVTAQEKEERILDNILNQTNINLLLRSSYEMALSENSEGSFRLNEARLDIGGKIVENLNYRVRYRLNRPQDPNSVDNAPSALDYAMLEYTFGNDNKWQVNIGKQANDFGSWEFEKNPTFEYVYSDYINQQQNIFMVGGRLSYQANENNSFRVQAYNTMNTKFADLYATTQYAQNNLKAAKAPIGLNFTWRGDFFDKKFQTYYSTGFSHVAANKTNYQFALGNKVVMDKWEAYFDLQQTNMAVDFVNMISPAINTYRLAMNPAYTNMYAENIQFQSAVLRVDYAITPNWYITGKTIFERINDRNDNGLGKNMSSHNTNMFGVEYKPFRTQDFKMFGYFSNTNRKYNSTLGEYASVATPKNMIGIGMLYYVKAL